jgi:hypothetical protein
MKTLPWLFLYFALLFPIGMLSALVAWNRLRKKSGREGDRPERPVATPALARKAG